METSGVLHRLRAQARPQGVGEEARADLASLYDAYAGPLYRYGLTLLSDPDQAEDIVQDVFLGLLRRQAPGPIDDLRAYLFRAARNAALHARRREDRQPPPSWVSVEACTPSQRDLALDLQKAFAQLPLAQREVVSLKLAEDLTFREIAQILHISANTAASRYRLALSRLRQLLKGSADDA